MSERASLPSNDKIKAWCWDYRGPSGRKFVLMAMCQWVTPLGQVHNLAVAHLAELVCLDESRVRNHIRRLVLEGILERTQDRLKPDGRFAVCRYQVRAPWLIEAPAACSRCGLPFKLGFERDGAMVCNYCLTGIPRETAL
jgi:hypothetical protein